MTPVVLVSVMPPLSSRAEPTLELTVTLPVAPLRLRLFAARRAPELIVQVPVNALLSTEDPKTSAPLSLLAKVLAAVPLKAEFRVRTLPVVTSMPEPVSARLKVRLVANVPVARKACEALLRRTTLAESPSAELAATWRTPPVTSMIELLPPNVLTPERTNVPAPDFVRTTLAAPVAPPETMPVSVNPCCRLELEALPTLYTGPVAPSVALSAISFESSRPYWLALARVRPFWR